MKGWDGAVYHRGIGYEHSSAWAWRLSTSVITDIFVISQTSRALVLTWTRNHSDAKVSLLTGIRLKSMLTH